MYQGMLSAGFSADEARQWTCSLVPHHQWMIVSVEHALVLVAMRDKILQVRGSAGVLVTSMTHCC
jgi:hypothetical protein